MTSQNHATLSKLTGTGMTVDNATDDMRGRKVTDKDGKDVGKVQDVFVDDRERKGPLPARRTRRVSRYRRKEVLSSGRRDHLDHQ